jgi:hypothetical protein
MASSRASNVPALLLAPIGGAIAGGALYAILLLALRLPAQLVFQLAPLVALAHLPFALAATWLVGLPWHLHLQQTRRTRSLYYWSAGAFFGALLGAALFALATRGGTQTVSLYPSDLPRDHSVISEAHGIANLLGGVAVGGGYGALIGALTGLFAWLIRRPDRDQPSADPSKDTSA